MRMIKILQFSLILLIGTNLSIKLDHFSYKIDSNDNCMLSTKLFYLICDRLKDTEFSVERYLKFSDIFLIENVYFQLRQESILKAENFLKLFNLWNNLYNRLSITFSNLLGINANTFFMPNFTYSNFKLYKIEIYYSSLNLYLNNTLIIDCESIKPIILPVLKFYILSLNYGNNYRYKICPQIFNNINVYQFKLSYLIDSFYKRNILSFYEFNQSYNIEIKELYIEQAQNIIIDKNLVNKQIFSSIQTISLFGSINSIQNDLFKSFKNLKRINIDIYSARRLLSQGIEWIKSLNSDLNIDPKNISKIKLNKQRIVSISINFNPDHLPNDNIKSNQVFPDEDFCLYLEYPFNQMIFLGVQNSILYELKEYYPKYYTCTYLWLTQYLNYYWPFIDFKDKEILGYSRISYLYYTIYLFTGRYNKFFIDYFAF